MLFQIFMTIVITVTWMLFQNSFTIVDLGLGYAVSIGIVFFFISLKGERFYLGRVWAAFVFIAVFLRELVVANLHVAKIVISPKIDIEPGIIAIPTKLQSETEKTLLAASLTLTPGSLSMEFSEDGKTLFVHFLEAGDREERIRFILDTFEKRILEVTRDYV
ncbi:Na+/H+ antiporter subunit E [Alkalihalobacillus pseudalcaliphilus]|uniref:Na+/H+ antiporter subunit E n=1 Tax=Alkalihalobacillus pseudalcaliphilus TaxID=79884 RepID=UPI00064DE0F0|nr:Na+/H+ antiporter subunit E [Alkalihalobacillus pseudalcaliphilus]KMK77200.1 monovalent cation/H+ antiporter subunit E [Alkalihalobacillus pseudalcaliphilus]